MNEIWMMQKSALRDCHSYLQETEKINFQFIQLVFVLLSI